MRLIATALIVLALPLSRIAWRQFARWRFSDPEIDKLIKKPTDRGFGRHDEAQEREARKRREDAHLLARDAVRARLPHRWVLLERRFGGRRS